MGIIDFTEETKLNMVGGRYVRNNYYVDVTEHYWCYGFMDSPKPFGQGIECTEAQAREWLLTTEEDLMEMLQ